MADVVTLTDVRTHLRWPNPTQATADDTNLQGFISAANDVIVAECDDVMPKVYTETHDGGRLAIYLRHLPVLDVALVEEGWGYVNYVLDYQQPNTIPATSMFAYSNDNPSFGEIRRRSAGNVNIPFVPGMDNIRVVYTAGLAAVPGAVRLAALELIAHWWDNSQYRSSAGNAIAEAYDATVGERFTHETEGGIQSMNFGVPYRILEMLRKARRMPKFS